MAIHDELNEITLQLAQLEKQKQQLLERQRDLEHQLQGSRQTEDQTKLLSQQEQTSSFSAHERLIIFSTLFKGRDDVFATRWDNTKTGRSGYSPACANEWKKGVCFKPQVKCTDCNAQQFKPLDLNQLYQHLTGQQTIGLYVLQSDNQCHFLALDFDKTGWQEAVKATAEVCAELHLPNAIEISRSGNGAHLWLFFKEPVSASRARQLGFLLLDLAMEKSGAIGFESYDRMFPNQDFVPDGGFGNLIALPLQHQPRQRGCSVFVDSQLLPVAEQWLFLAQLRRITATQLDELLSRFVAKNGEVPQPIKHSEIPEFNEQPWLRYQDKTSASDDTVYPEVLEITISNRLYFNYTLLPAKLSTMLRRIGSFSNPQFFKTQALRFSTQGIPRFISCAQIENSYLSLPRGCLDDVIALCKEKAIRVDLVDRTNSGKSLEPVCLNAELRKPQLQAVNAMLAFDTGILHAPTAFGKTVTALALIAKRNVSTLILTHSKQLVEQWLQRINTFLAGVECGIWSGSKKKLSGCIDVATYQSLIDKKDNTVHSLVQDYGYVIIDECHHICAPRFEMVLNDIAAKYITGLTATPVRQDGQQKIMLMLAGPIRHKAQQDSQGKFRQIAHVAQLHFSPPDPFMENQPHISELYRWIAEHEQRSLYIVDKVITEVKEGRMPLLLSERKQHTTTLAKLLADRGIQCAVLTGGMKAAERKMAEGQLAHCDVLIATGKYIGEGFDLPKLDTLFITMPLSWKGTLAQYAGRVQRDYANKQEVRIFDFVDEHPVLQRMYKKREKGYLAMGYSVVLE